MKVTGLARKGSVAALASISCRNLIDINGFRDAVGMSPGYGMRKWKISNCWVRNKSRI